MLGDDPELAAAAQAAGVEIIDYRRPPAREETAIGRGHAPGKHVILTVGTDCAIGKMSVALELRRAAVEAGLAAVFVPTGQTGMMIDGWGVAVDRVISDFSNGTGEWLVEQAEAKGDWIIVEGQGSLDHPAYSAVTLGLIHGTTPQAMVMVHKPGLAEHDWAHIDGREFPLQPLSSFIKLHEQVAGIVAPSRVVAVALNTSLYPVEADARRVIDEIAAETGLPVDDPVRFGPARLWAGIQSGVEALGNEPLARLGRRPGRRSRDGLDLRQEVIRLPYREPFRIARAHGGEGMSSVIVELRHPAWPGLVGYGEGYPDPYYGETLETVAVVLPRLLATVDPGELAAVTPADGARLLETLAAGFDAAIARHGAAKCALDTALHDLVGKRLGQPVHRLLGLSPEIGPTDFTIGLDEPAVVAARAERAGHFPALKIKVGGRPISRPSRPSGASSPVRSGSTPTPAGRPNRVPP